MMEPNVKEQLMGIQNQLSGLIKDPRLQQVVLGGPGGGGGPPASGSCLLTQVIRTREDFLDALNKIHQWIGYIIEVLDAKPE